MKQERRPILGDKTKTDPVVESSLSNIPSFTAPWWCRNGHVHTVARSLLSRPDGPAVERLEIATPDDDFLELDVAEGPAGAPAVLLLHGLEGSSRRYYIVELTNHLSGLGCTVVAMNFRGCGSRLNRQRRFYHSGDTRDVQTVLRWMQGRFPGAALGAVGFSLGGNVLLKSLGEQGGNHPLQAAAAVSVPYHLKAGSLLLQKGVNRVYEYHFLRTLTAKLAQKRNTYPDLPRFRGSTLYDFDDQVTAPLHGFTSADDYYARCSSRAFLDGIGRPTLLVHSRADPICPVSRMPLQAIRQNESLHYVITRQGGHVGFCSRPPGWLSTAVGTFLGDYLWRG